MGRLQCGQREDINQLFRACFSSAKHFIKLSIIFKRAFGYICTNWVVLWDLLKNLFSSSIIDAIRLSIIKINLLGFSKMVHIEEFRWCLICLRTALLDRWLSARFFEIIKEALVVINIYHAFGLPKLQDIILILFFAHLL